MCNSAKAGVTFFFPFLHSQSAFETCVTLCQLCSQGYTAVKFVFMLKSSHWLPTVSYANWMFWCSDLDLLKNNARTVALACLPSPPWFNIHKPIWQRNVISAEKGARVCFVFCLQDPSLISLQYFPPHTRCLSFFSSPICYLQTVALHMHALVRIVRLFRSTIALGFGSGTKGFILVVQICFTRRGFISNSLSASQGRTWWHVLGFQSLLKYPAPLQATKPIILQF